MQQYHRIVYLKLKPLKKEIYEGEKNQITSSQPNYNHDARS